ncbi:hypothetical protein QYE76_036317 [Lolium multiflorum]|uniref:Uncharacterized protein n=1 Tax=Lolium multiflorum TaxID=4521 RepID=A0AAD8R465_LOLMU|nr:hypothetical protein QYE76_036317 [Lolium multiflorum]
MINWTEAAVALRDSYDQDNGRGKGILKIEDNITEEYRRQYGKKTDGNKNMGAEIKKPGTGRSNGKGNGRSTGKASSSRKPGPSWEIKMETTMKRMMQDFKREIMEELPERCAKDVVKLLNKSGVRYKPLAETLSDQYCYDEGCGSYLNGVPERKEFVYDKKSDTRSVSLPKEDVDKVSKEGHKEEDYITPARTKCDFLGDGTPDNPWQPAEDFKEASSSEYLYWEKVQPLDEIALYARISSRPLMINWTEAVVALRDSYDQDNGRGKGILKIEDNITEEYRRQYGKKTDGNKNMGAEIKKPGTGRSNGKGNGRSTGKASSSRKPGPSWEIKMETTMKRMMQDFKMEIMEELPERCAKDVVKLLNKSGVRYKPLAETLSDQYCYDEGCGSYLNGVPERKEFVYDKKSDTRSVSLPKEDVDNVSKEGHKEEDYITPARTKCDFVGDGTPDNPWQPAEDFKEASSSEVPSNIFEPALKNMNKEDEHK